MPALSQVQPCVRYRRMSRGESNSDARSMARRSPREQFDSKTQARSVRSASRRHWQPPEGLSPEQVRAVIAAANCDCDRLLLRVLWATAARVSAVLALWPMDVHRDSLILPDRTNPNITVKRVFVPGAETRAQGRALAVGKRAGRRDHEPLFVSRKRDPGAPAAHFGAARHR
jgi:site-specific recombinase XerD